MIVDDKPDLMELAHYGVKGMKWGVRRKRSSSSSSSPAKPSTQEIRNARIRQNSRRIQINNQAVKLNLATGKAKDREAKKLNKLQMDFLDSPDRATELRLTRGEKAVLTVFAVSLPIVGTAGVAVGAGARLAARKSIEKEQKVRKG